MGCKNFTTVFRRGDYLLRKAHLARFDRIDGTYYNQAMAMFRYYALKTGCLRPNFLFEVVQTFMVLKVQHPGSNTTELASMLYSLPLQMTQAG